MNPLEGQITALGVRESYRLTLRLNPCAGLSAHTNRLVNRWESVLKRARSLALARTPIVPSAQSLYYAKAKSLRGR
jgi:hypothetical protein